MIPLSVAVVAVFVGGYVQGATGFAFAMITVPPIFMVMPPQLATPVLVIMSLMNSSYLFARYRTHVTYSAVIPLIVGGGLGVPFGIYFLERVDGPVLKIFIGIFLVMFAAALLMGWQRPIKNQMLASLPVGFVSGLLNGSTSLSGPPVIIFLANQGIQKDRFRANMVTYFMLVNALSIIMLFVAGMMTREVIEISAIVTPALICSTLLGARAADRVSDEGFRKFAMLCAMVMGAALIVTSLFAITD